LFKAIESVRALPASVGEVLDLNKTERLNLARRHSSPKRPQLYAKCGALLRGSKPPATCTLAAADGGRSRATLFENHKLSARLVAIAHRVALW